MKIHSILVLVILFFGMSSCSKKTTSPPKGTQSKTNIHFIEGIMLMDIADMAQTKDMPIFMYMHADWCLPCQLMEEEVFTHKPTSKFINENFISYKVDAEEANGPDLKILYEIDQLPGVFFLDHRGRVLEKEQGAVFHQKLMDMANSALQKEALTYLE